MTLVYAWLALVLLGPWVFFGGAWIVLTLYYWQRGYPLTRTALRHVVAHQVEMGYMSRTQAGSLLDTAPRRARSDSTAYAAGALASFASGGYAAARFARSAHAVETGRIGPRLANIAIGRAIGRSGIWRR